MNRGDMRQEVRERLHELDPRFWTDSEINRALEEANVRFGAEERWPWLLAEGTATLAPDDDEITFPENVAINRFTSVGISGASLGWAQELERIRPDEGFKMRRRWATSTGRPVYYYTTRAERQSDDENIVSYVMRVVPAADLDYDIEYQYAVQPTAMDSDESSPDCPVEYHDAIVSWATGKLFLKEIELSRKAEEQFGIYMKVVEQARKEIQLESTDQIVAWGRSHPGEYYTRDYSLWRRLPPTLG